MKKDTMLERYPSRECIVDIKAVYRQFPDITGKKRRRQPTKKERKRKSPLLLGFDPLHPPVELLVLLQEDEGGDRVRTQPDEAGHPAAEGPGVALLAGDLAQQGGDALAVAVAGGHDAGLDHVDGAADGGGDEAGHERGGEVRAQVVRHADALDAQLLEGVVRGQLRGGHQHRARRVRPHPAEQAGGALGARHLHQPVEGVAVVAALRRRQGRVRLHAHVQHVRRVAGPAADEARGARDPDQREETRRRPGRREIVLEFLVDAEPRRRVGHLAQKRG